MEDGQWYVRSEKEEESCKCCDMMRMKVRCKRISKKCVETKSYTYQTKRTKVKVDAAVEGVYKGENREKNT